MARGRRKRTTRQKYWPYLVKVMSFKDNCVYDVESVDFSDEQLYELTPVVLRKWMSNLAFGTEEPGPEDRPKNQRGSSLDQAKKAISFFMPNKNSAWNPQSACGNPTRSMEVNSLIKDVRKFEVQKQGRASNVKRDLKRAEFRKTLRLFETHRSGNFAHKFKFPTMMKFQFHIIGRADDICNLETEDLRSHDKFDFALQTKVSWSKNVMDERDCPDQILFGANDTDFCVLVALSCYLESRLSGEGTGCNRFLFGDRDEEEEPDRMNSLYRDALSGKGGVWNEPEFQEILRLVRGSLGTHSNRKFPATWAAENNMLDREIEIRGRWKGAAGGRTVNTYINVEQLPTDAKVAAVLCVGGPIKYKLKEGSHVTRRFLIDVVAPGIHEYFGTDESNRIAEILALPLLWACHEPALEHMMSHIVHTRVTEGYGQIRGGHDGEYNPVVKVPLFVSRIENQLCIDELIGGEANGNDGQVLVGAQGANAQRENMLAMVQQMHQMRQRQAQMQQAIELSIASHRAFCAQQFQVMNRNINRYAMMPIRVVGRRAGARAVDEVAGDDDDAAVITASLSYHPRTLLLLWNEWMYGLEGRKAAKDFTAYERGRCRHKFSRRRHVWSRVARLVRGGYTAETAVSRIRQCFGLQKSVSGIIEAMKKDKAEGGDIDRNL